MPTERRACDEVQASRRTRAYNQRTATTVRSSRSSQMRLEAKPTRPYDYTVLGEPEKVTDKVCRKPCAE